MGRASRRMWFNGIQTVVCATTLHQESLECKPSFQISQEGSGEVGIFDSRRFEFNFNILFSFRSVTDCRMPAS